MFRSCLRQVSGVSVKRAIKAQAFIESRSDKPAQVSPWLYRSTDGNDTDYLIYEVRVV